MPVGIGGIFSKEVGFSESILLCRHRAAVPVLCVGAGGHEDHFRIVRRTCGACVRVCLGGGVCRAGGARHPHHHRGEPCFFFVPVSFCCVFYLY